MKTTKITQDQAWEMQRPYLKGEVKKELGITGYQFLRGWDVNFETGEAYKISGFNETGDAVRKELEDVEAWIPKSQTKIFKSPDSAPGDYQEPGEILIFVKTWLYNKNKFKFNLNEFRNITY